MEYLYDLNLIPEKDKKLYLFKVIEYSYRGPDNKGSAESEIFTWDEVVKYLKSSLDSFKKFAPESKFAKEYRISWKYDLPELIEFLQKRNSEHKAFIYSIFIFKRELNILKLGVKK